jgi:hypothetical protein
MPQLKKVVEPFGEVHVYPAGNGQVRVVATISTEPRHAGATTGIALEGKILDPAGKTIMDFSRMGVPSQLDFLVPAGSTYFTLEVNSRRIHQPLSDENAVPPSEPFAAKATPVVVPIMTQRRIERKTRSGDFDESPQTIPLWKLNLELESQKEEWTDFDLDVEKKVSDIDRDTRDGNKK